MPRVFHSCVYSSLGKFRNVRVKSDERWSDEASAGSWGDRGRRDGHHVEVESNEGHTVRRLKDTEDRFNNHGGKRGAPGRSSTSAR